MSKKRYQINVWDPDLDRYVPYMHFDANTAAEARKKYREHAERHKNERRHQMVRYPLMSVTFSVTKQILWKKTKAPRRKKKTKK